LVAIQIRLDQRRAANDDDAGQDCRRPHTVRINRHSRRFIRRTSARRDGKDEQHQGSHAAPQPASMTHSPSPEIQRTASVEHAHDTSINATTAVVLRQCTPATDGSDAPEASTMRCGLRQELIASNESMKRSPQERPSTRAASQIMAKPPATRRYGDFWSGRLSGSGRSNRAIRAGSASG
jgi:hypothetical protein